MTNLPADDAVNRTRTVSKRIMAISPRTRGGRHTALPFETDDDVMFAWRWLLDGGYLRDVYDRPGEKYSAIRGLLQLYIKGGEGLPAVDSELARLLIASVYGSELDVAVHELVTPATEQPDATPAG